MVINHNMTSINANNNLKFKNVSLGKDIEKLSSGQKINRAGDDAANLAVSEKMRSQIRGLSQAERNIQNGVSFVQATEGYLQESQDVLQRIRELAIQASNGVYSDEDRMYIQVEVSQMIDEINRIASHAQFNGMNMLTGKFAGEESALMLHVGANVDQRKAVSVGDMTATGLGITQISLATADEANGSLATIDEALKTLNKQRADLGAYQNRFEVAQKGVAIAAENLQAAESVIRDADMANEMVNFTRDNILVQAGSAMLAQANTKTQSVMRLLG
ncbi:MAG: flagellin [Spirochaetales bacterium]|nr:flagellin [Spirochaetales bacterium]